MRFRPQTEYQHRVVDDQLEKLLSILPAISIEGPRAVGKTWTGSRWARTTYDLDDPETLALVEADPSKLVRGEPPVFIDEWQRYPPSWDLVRRAVDRGAPPGSFLLAGSTAPETPPTHSGAGRIVTLRMRPMSLAERGVGKPTVSIGALLQGDRPPIDGETDEGLEDYVDEIMSGGFPGLRRLSAAGLRFSLDGYLDRAVEHDLALMGYRVRRPGILRRWLSAYAAATATTAKYETIRDAATGGEADKPARTTTAAYRDLLEAMWLVDPLPAWWPVGRPLGRLKRGPKHHLADPAFAARLMGATGARLLSPDKRLSRLAGSGPLLGALFESLVTLNVRVYAQAARANVSHLRSWGDRQEVDLIVEKEGQVVAIEVKLSAVAKQADTSHLRWLRHQLGDNLADAVIVTTGRYAYRDRDGIAVVPAALLGP